MGRAPCCDKASVKRGPWSPEEDAVLRSYIQKHGTGGNWITLPLKAGLKRCGKSCRLRWLNYLRPDIKHGGFTEAEDDTILSLYSSIGSRWSVIASHLPGRTDNDVKNHWNTKLKKKLMAAIQSPPPPPPPPPSNYAASGFGYAAEPHRLFWELAQLPPLSLVEMPNIASYMDSGSAASSSTTNNTIDNCSYANWCVNGAGGGGVNEWFMSGVSDFGPPAGDASLWGEAVGET